MRVFLLIACLGASLAGAWAEDNPGIPAEPAGWSLGRPAPSATPTPSLKRVVQAPPADTIQPTEEEAPYIAPAREGQTWAQTRLGVLYASAHNDPARWKRGAELLCQAADKNDTEALCTLSGMAAEGRGMQASEREAFGYMERAAKLGLPEAQRTLALMYAEGRGTPKDPSAATGWARRAAEAGDAEAMFFLGKAMLGSADQGTHEQGLAWMHKAVARGQAAAALMLGTAYGRGEMGLAKDEVKAEAALKPSAEKGDADCQMALAGLYRFGETFPAKRAEAYIWLKRAADSGHPRAIEVLQADQAP